MSIIQITFKTPDAIDYALDEMGLSYNDEYLEERQGLTDEEIYELKAKWETLFEKFISWRENITIEFNLDKGTATVVPARG